MVRLIATGALVLMLGGCAGSGMDLAQCRTADWRAIGYEDGSQGRSATALGKRRQDCAGHGVTPHFAIYMEGHAQGIAQFCRPQNGYRLGARGYRYGGVCPTTLEDSFLFAHAEGFGLYQRRTAVTRLSKKLRRKHKRSKKIERLMVQKTTALVVAKTPPSQRLTLGVEIKQLTEERIQIERTINHLEMDLEQAQYEYESYNASVAHR